MTKEEFDSTIEAGQAIAFDANTPPEDRTIQGAWISAAIAKNVPSIDITSALVVGVITVKKIAVDTFLKFSDCTLESLDAGGCEFNGWLAFPNCHFTGSLSLTGAKIKRGLALRGVTVSGSLGLSFAIIDVQLNVSEGNIGRLECNGVTVNGDCAWQSLVSDFCTAQKATIAGALRTDNLRVAGNMDIIGLSCSHWAGQGTQICGDLLAHNLSVQAALGLAGARVSGPASFVSCKVGGTVSLASSEFLGGLDIAGSTIELLDMTGARIHRGFSGAYSRLSVMNGTDIEVLGDLVFNDSTASSTVSWMGAQISGLALFERSRFGGSVDFRGSQRFPQSTFTGNAMFGGCQVSGQLIFANAIFHSDLLFPTVDVKADVVLHDATVQGSIFADGAVVAGAIKAERLTVNGNIGFGRVSASGGIDLSHCNVLGTFDGTASHIGTTIDFRNGRVGPINLIRASVQAALHLQSATVNGDIDLRNATIDEIALQTTFGKKLGIDAGTAGAIILQGTSYNHLRTGWEWLAKHLSDNIDRNEDALYYLETHLRKRGRIPDSEAVYRFRRNAEWQRAPSLKKIALLFLNWTSGYGVDRGRVIIVAIALLALAVILCIVVPDFVLVKGAKCSGKVTVDGQVAAAVALQHFFPLKAVKDVDVSSCKVFYGVSAFMLIVCLQMAGLVLLPVVIGTLTGWFRMQSEPHG